MLSVGVHRDWRHRIPLELELVVVVSLMTMVLGTKFGSSGRAICVLNHQAISSSPIDCFLNIYYFWYALCMYLCVCAHACACMPIVPTELPPQPITCILFHTQCNFDIVSRDYSTAFSHLLRGGSGQEPQ